MGIDVTAFGLPIDVLVEGKRKGREKKPPRKEMGYRAFPKVKRIGRPKAVTSILILLGHYRQLHHVIYFCMPIVL